MRFGRPKGDAKGYDEEEVDQFLDKIAEAFAGRSRMSPEEVHRVIFSSAKSARHGYETRQVDDFLARVVWQLQLGRVAPTRLRVGEDLRRIRLPKTTHGYETREVDLFVVRAADALDGRNSMTAHEVFRTRFSSTSGLHRGYQVATVDAMLEVLEQELRSRGRG